VISRYPLFAARRGGVRFGYAALDLDSVVAVGNLHLTATPYGPEAVRDGRGPNRVLALERSVRLPEIRPWLRPLARLGRSGTPTFLVGDFNSPSHLDWTAAASAAFPQRVKFPLAWPVSSALAVSAFATPTARRTPTRSPGPGSPGRRARRHRGSGESRSWTASIG
jgi:hypothetical protein